MTYRMLTTKYEVDTCFLSTLHYILGESKNEIFLIDRETDITKHKLIEKEFEKRFNVFAICALHKINGEEGLNCVINLDILRSNIPREEYDYIFGELNREQSLSISLCVRFIDALFRTNIGRGSRMDYISRIEKVKELYNLDSREHDNKLILNIVKIKGGN